jgi:prepilin-type N-terminal cleavage/methylation domain-containing protein
VEGNEVKARAGSQHGFTIIEVLLVIAIMGVFLTLAAPSFVTYTSSQKVKTASFDLYAAMMFARSEAIKRRTNVTITPASSDWKNGWTVHATIAGVDTTLRAQDPLRRPWFTVSTGA